MLLEAENPFPDIEFNYSEGSVRWNEEFRAAQGKLYIIIDDNQSSATDDLIEIPPAEAERQRPLTSQPTPEAAPTASYPTSSSPAGKDFIQSTSRL